MVVPAAEGIDLFKIAGRSISGWIPSLKTGTASHVRQPFCSQLEERLLLWLEYHPQVKSYAHGDIGQEFATTYRLPTPKHAPFAIGYTFEGKPHDYLPDIVGRLKSGKLFIGEAGMEDDKRNDRNRACAEAARRLARLQRGVFWIGTERTLTRFRHYNLVFLHARRQSFPAFADIAAALEEIWPWGEVAAVCEVASRFGQRWPANLVEAAIWKVVADATANGHLLVDLERHTLDRTLPLALLPPDAAPLAPEPLPDILQPEPDTVKPVVPLEVSTPIPSATFDASQLSEQQREQFHRNLRAVGQVLAGARTADIIAALWPERCKALVSVSGYLIGSQQSGKGTLPPKAELAWWYQYYFATERGRAGYEKYRHDFAKLIWQLASPHWDFDDATFDRSAAAFDNPDHVSIVIHTYRWRLGLAEGEPNYDELKQRLAELPDITVPTITLEGDANGAPHPDASAYTRKFSGGYAYRVITGVGHNLPQEAPLDFAQAIIDVDSF